MTFPSPSERAAIVEAYALGRSRRKQPTGGGQVGGVERPMVRGSQGAIDDEHVPCPSQGAINDGHVDVPC